MRSINSLRRLMPYAVVALAICIAVIWMPFLLGCPSSGACVGFGPVNECKQGWSKAECAEWDDLGVNGDSWTFYAGRDCADLGYPVECPDGSYVQDAGDC